MLTLRNSLYVASLCTLALGNPLARSLQLQESRSTIPVGFTRVGEADASTVLNLRLGLVSNNVDGLIETLYDVSTPSSLHYGQHLSRPEAVAYLAPTSETTATVNAWLSENNLAARTLNNAGDWLAISLPVSQANELFGADFSTFTHDETGAQSIRTLAYSIPTDLVGHLQLVHPTTTFTPPSAKLPLTKQRYTGSLKKRQSACSSYIDPDCLQEIYGIPATPMTNSNPLVVTGYDNQWPSTSDMSNFLTNFRPDIDSSTTWSTWGLDNGTWDPSQPGDEAACLDCILPKIADLDVEYTVGVATNAEVYFLSVGSDTDDGVFGFLDTATAVLDSWSDTYVMTTSYGSNEDSISTDVFSKLCDEYAALGSAGITVLFASGDGGVSGLQSGSCTDFVPTFPAGCPYLTSVGGTTSYSPETAASLSGGGFSNVFSTPSFQSADVSAYLATLGSTYSGLFNPNGRGFPDVAAQAENVIIAWQGDFYTVGGTSCASPIFASVISLLNDELLNAGQSRLGWLNPWLYANPGALYDITSGDNPGCGTNGFSATTGWDPVTGLGSPNYAALRSAAGL
ncbi:family S53 protease-like protein [Fomitopsis serialis]|uniref:family S53 protease-like protein n=1 Tax=Fomitopsis serialis TaxID=139415 RepID=UPI0020078EB7|nr:family S53 protease-like protein [Neoantrodia serialis]KAH9929420.1 family S53 protease-like protein [Neoantrodia serialis]